MLHHSDSDTSIQSSTELQCPDIMVTIPYRIMFMLKRQVNKGSDKSTNTAETQNQMGSWFVVGVLHPKVP